MNPPNLYGLQLKDYSLCLGWSKEQGKYLFLEQKPCALNDYQLIPTPMTLQEMEEIGFALTENNRAIIGAACIEILNVKVHTSSQSEYLMKHFWQRFMAYMKESDVK